MPDATADHQHSWFDAAIAEHVLARHVLVVEGARLDRELGAGVRPAVDRDRIRPGGAHRHVKIGVARVVAEALGQIGAVIDTAGDQTDDLEAVELLIGEGTRKTHVAEPDDEYADVAAFAVLSMIGDVSRMLHSGAGANRTGRRLDHMARRLALTNGTTIRPTSFDNVINTNEAGDKKPIMPRNMTLSRGVESRLEATMR